MDAGKYRGMAQFSAKTFLWRQFLKDGAISLRYLGTASETSVKH
jgi:hypothetical protein